MSTWENIEPKDIELDYEGREVNVLVGENADGGNHYLVLTFAQIKKLYEEITNE